MAKVSSISDRKSVDAEILAHALQKTISEVSESVGGLSTYEIIAALEAVKLIEWRGVMDGL